MIALHNQFGQIALDVIDPREVAKLSDAQQKCLAVLISAVQEREAAQERFTKAVLATREATFEQEAAMAAHVEANPPMTFQQAQQQAIAAFNKSR